MRYMEDFGALGCTRHRIEGLEVVCLELMDGIEQKLDQENQWGCDVLRSLLQKLWRHEDGSKAYIFELNYSGFLPSS
jgi:hypothetical protein